MQAPPSWTSVIDSEHANQIQIGGVSIRYFVHHTAWGLQGGCHNFHNSASYFWLRAGVSYNQLKTHQIIATKKKLFRFSTSRDGGKEMQVTITEKEVSGKFRDRCGHVSRTRYHTKLCWFTID